MNKRECFNAMGSITRVKFNNTYKNNLIPVGYMEQYFKYIYQLLRYTLKIIEYNLWSHKNHFYSRILLRNTHHRKLVLNGQVFEKYYN